MNRHCLTWHILYRFPTLYLAILATSALTWRLAPPAGIPRILSLIISLLFTVILLYSAARVAIIFEKRENLYAGEKTDKEKLAFLWGNAETRLFLLLFILFNKQFDCLDCHADCRLGVNVVRVVGVKSCIVSFLIPNYGEHTARTRAKK